MAGTATLLAGFSLAGEGVCECLTKRWGMREAYSFLLAGSEPKVIALLVVGVVLLALGALNECSLTPFYVVLS